MRVCYSAPWPPLPTSSNFHTTTLVGQWVYLIGGLGDQGHRRIGITPVYRLDTNTLKVERIVAVGGPPGRLNRRRAVFLADANAISVWDSTAASEQDQTSYLFDLADNAWRDDDKGHSALNS